MLNSHYKVIVKALTAQMIISKKITFLNKSYSSETPVKENVHLDKTSSKEGFSFLKKELRVSNGLETGFKNHICWFSYCQPPQDTSGEADKEQHNLKVITEGRTI